MQKAMNPTRVLVIEDQASIRKLIGGYLRAQDLEVFEASSLDVARRVCDLWKPNVVLLDVILNNEDGIDFLREKHDAVKTIVFSSRHGVTDRIKALEIGAVDYLAKPVDPRELYLKIRKLDDFRHSGRTTNVEERLGDLTLDVLTRNIIGPTKSIRLSKSEILMLRMFLNQNETPFSKEDISRAVLGRRFSDGSRAVDVMVSKIRAKLRAAGSKIKILNVRERGYMAVYTPPK
jgi:two-component system OmpR family response regulator